MSHPYLQAKLKDAILAARGDRTTAVRLLMETAAKDSALLAALTQPYLQGIAFQAVDRVLQKLQSRGQPNRVVPGTAPAKKRELPPEALDNIVETLSQRIPTPPRQAKAPLTPEEMLNSIGIDPNGPPPSPAGQRHKSAIATMAASFKRF